MDERLRKQLSKNVPEHMMVAVDFSLSFLK